MKYTHLVRVYRGSLQVRHDLNTILNFEDVNGTDVFAQVKPVSDLVVELTPQGIPSGHRCELWLPTDYDLDRGYFVELKKTRVLDGTREAVSGTLTSAVEAGDTVLPLAHCIGFKSGERIIVTNGVTSESTRVKSVGSSPLPYDDYAVDDAGSSLTLYDDLALENAYAEGSTVRASTMYRVIDMPSPDGVRPYRIAVLMQVAAQGSID